MSDSADTPRSDDSLQLVLQSIFDKMDRGEPCEIEAWIARYPAHEVELRRFFASHALMEGLAAPLPTSATSVKPASKSNADTPTAPTDRKWPGFRLDLPRRLNDYELLEEISRGGMGVVYKARQVSLNRLVAVKVLLGGPDASPESLARFLAEAEAAAGLDHPNIVPIHEIGFADGRPFFSMKLISGTSLAGLLHSWAEARGTNDQGSLGHDRQRWIATLVAQIARAVHYAHQRGIVHRDLKPGNILLSGESPAESVPFVTDFGLAKLIEGDSNLTQSGAVVGTPSYMSPEQARGDRNITPAADIYGLGAILYHLLTGHRPHDAGTPMATLLAVQSSDPIRPRIRNPNVDRNLETICLKTMMREPDQRYRTALDLAEDLERWSLGEPIQARRAGVGTRTVAWARRRPTVFALIAAILLASGLLVERALRTSATTASDERRDLENYASQLAHVQKLLDEKQFEAAGRALQECPPSLRHWEWRYLKRLCTDKVDPKEDGRIVPTDWTSGAMFSADGKQLALPMGQIWHAGSDEPKTLVNLTRPVFSSCGRRVAAVSPQGICVWDGNNWTGPPTKRIDLAPDQTVHFLIFDRAGERLAVSMEERKPEKEPRFWVEVRNLDNAAERIELPLTGWCANSLTFLSDKRHLLMTTQDAGGAMWDLVDRKQLFTMGKQIAVPITDPTEYLEEGTYAADFAPKHSLIAMAAGTKLTLLNGSTGQIVRELPSKGRVCGVSFSSDSERLATAATHDCLCLWHPGTGILLARFGTRIEPTISFVAFSPDGTHIAASGKEGQLVIRSAD